MNSSETIAICGMSCRFPGDANNPQSYWELLKNKVDAITEVPNERWDINEYYDPDIEVPGKMHVRHGGFLKDVGKFDNGFFNISPIEAESLDPQTRLLLELSHEALEDSLISTRSLKNSRSGVFIGMSTVDYVEHSTRSIDPKVINAYSGSGTSFATASGRISYTYGLVGPSMTVDSACSSSLVALHLGVQSLLDGESDLVIAGAVNMNLSPKTYLSYAKLNALSVNGRCKAFAADRDGFVRSEGGAIVILKRYEDAIRDNDIIKAVVLGSAVTNDGAGQGFTVPNASAQSKAISEAIRKAMVEPDEISYIEAHGTGTPVGDPTEIQGIIEAFHPREKNNKLHIGSAKTNIGHAEPAAGMAGLLKVILSIQHRTIPPNLHFNTPNPEIDWNTLPINIPVEPTPWSCQGKRLVAGINSFGLSGTNAHVIVAEPPFSDGAVKVVKSEIIRREVVLPITAKSEGALIDLVNKYLSLINSENFTDDDLSSACHIAATKRAIYDYRCSVVGKDRTEVTSELKEICHERSFNKIENREEVRNIVFVFPGQGSQWVGMGRQLYENELVFRKSIEECEESFSHYVEWSLTEELYKDELHTRFSEVDLIQPIIFSIQVGLARLLQSLGIQPSYVLGYSMGEVAAAYCAGSLTLDYASRVICLRSTLAKKLSGSGAMAIVELSMAQISEFLQDYAQEVTVAASNSPKSVVISGNKNAVHAIVQTLESHEIFVKLIKVDYASHSPQIDLIKEELLHALGNIKNKSSNIPIASTVQATITDGSDFDENYWVDNLRNTVLFSQTIALLLELKNTIFIEVSPHPIIAPLIQQCIDHSGESAVVSHTVKRNLPEFEELIKCISFIFNNQGDVSWERFYHGYASSFTNLPLYPWQKENFWLPQAKTGYLGGATQSKHPLLGNFVRLAVEKETLLFSLSLEASALPFLRDHKVNGNIVFPGAGYVEQGLASARFLFKDTSFVLEDIAFNNVLLLGNSQCTEIQMVFNRLSESKLSFKVLSLSEDNFIEHARGIVRVGPVSFHPPLATEHLNIMNGTPFLPRETHYAIMKSWGIEYGPKFKLVASIWRDEKVTIGKVNVLPQYRPSQNSFTIHPALLDGCFQVSIGSLPTSLLQKQDTFLPARCGTVFWDADVEYSSYLIIIVTHKETVVIDDVFVRDIAVFNHKHELLGYIQNFAVQKLESKSELKEDKVSSLFYRTQWQISEEPLNPQVTSNDEMWLVFAINKNSKAIVNRISANHRVIAIYQGEAFLVQERDGNIEIHLNFGEEQQLSELYTAIYLNRKINPVKYIFIAEGSTSNQLNSEHLIERTLQFLKIIHLTLNYDHQSETQFDIVTFRTQKVLSTDQIDVEDSPIWGMARTAFHELSQYHIRQICVNSLSSITELGNLSKIITSKTKDKEFALRDASIFVSRLTHCDKQNEKEVKSIEKVRVEDSPFEMCMSEPGILQNIQGMEIRRVTPESGSVEVEVKAVGLNFANLMSALGIYPGKPNGFLSLALEFAGIVSKVGENVDGFKVGDKVIGTSVEAFRSHVITASDLIVRMPNNLTFEEAATIPIAFTTAYAALVDYARLQKGERVLIHSASGGVGISAIQIARHIGADIIATAGTESKREYLHSLGIMHVFDSRSLEFADDVKRVTAGEGVDVILNSLSGEAMFKSLELLRDFGRFVEIGKKDIYANNSLDLHNFKKGISYMFLDLIKALDLKRLKFREFLNHIAREFEKGIYKPMTNTVFPVSKAEDGFHFMAKGNHVGKIAFSMNDPDLYVVPFQEERTSFATNGAILITGGLGGLGLAAAEQIAKRGTKHLILMGRSTPSTNTVERVEKLRKQRVKVTIWKCDVTDYEAVKNLFETQLNSATPISGIIHAAGTLDDAVLLNLTENKVRQVMEPKVTGALNLHRLTSNTTLDFFVLYSSIASCLGSVGQANYVAANSFLDALAHHRRSHGLKATCINWGPVAEVGLAAKESIRGARLDKEGINSITIEEYKTILEEIFLNRLDTDTTVMKFNAKMWMEHNPSFKKSHFLDKLTNKNKEEKALTPLQKSLRDAKDFQTAKKTLEIYITEILSFILKTNVSKVPKDVPFVKLGLDSLMAVQFRNRIQNDLGIVLSVTKFWNYPKVTLLAEYIAETFKENESKVSSQEISVSNDSEAISEGSVNQLTMEEVSESLNDEFKSLLDE